MTGAVTWRRRFEPGRLLGLARRPGPVAKEGLSVFRRVLLPVDLSERSDLAVERASELAAQPGAAIILLHVVETIQDVPDQELEGFYGRLRDKAEKRLREWAHRLEAQGAEVRQEILFGRRGAQILRYAREQETDLIVLVSHALDPERAGGGFGTISHQVALLAPCSVLLVR